MCNELLNTAIQNAPFLRSTSVATMAMTDLFISLVFCENIVHAAAAIVGRNALANEPVSVDSIV